LRDALRDHAPALYPSRYPSPWPTTSGFLPETLPSSRVDIETRRGIVAVVGRGWGHGVGMSQWGAWGLARRGADHEAILTHYYTGTGIDSLSYPGPVEVGVDWGRSEVAVRGAFDITDGRGRILSRAAVGTWRFSWTGRDVVSVDPPRGYRLPLRVGVVRAPREARPGERARLTIALSRPAVVRAVAQGGTESEPAQGRILDAGRRVVVWRAPDEPGRYEVRVEASSGGTSKRSEVVEIAVESDVDAPQARADPERPNGDGAGDFVLPVLVVVGVLLLGGAIGLARRMR
jgi:hypothetical protein